MPAKDETSHTDIKKNSQDDDKKSVQVLVRSCINSVKGGVPLRTINDDYCNLIGENIPFEKFGYCTLKDFLKDTPDVCAKKDENGDIILSVRNEKTAHISKLVSGQRDSKASKRKLQFGFKRNLRLSVQNGQRVNRFREFDRNRSFTAAGNRNFLNNSTNEIQFRNKEQSKNNRTVPSLTNTKLESGRKVSSFASNGAEKESYQSRKSDASNNKDFVSNRQYKSKENGYQDSSISYNGDHIYKNYIDGKENCESGPIQISKKQDFIENKKVKSKENGFVLHNEDNVLKKNGFNFNDKSKESGCQYTISHNGATVDSASFMNSIASAKYTTVQKSQRSKIENVTKVDYKNGYSLFNNNSVDASTYVNQPCSNGISSKNLKERSCFSKIVFDSHFEENEVNVFYPVIGGSQLIGDDLFLQLSLAYLDCHFVRKSESSPVSCGTVQSGLSFSKAISKLKKISVMANRITICLGIIDIYQNEHSDAMIDNMIELLNILHNKFMYTPPAITLCTTPPLINLECEGSSKAKRKLENQFFFNDWIRRTAHANDYKLIDFFDRCLDSKGRIRESLFYKQENISIGSNCNCVLLSCKGRKKVMKLLLNDESN